MWHYGIREINRMLMAYGKHLVRYGKHPPTHGETYRGVMTHGETSCGIKAYGAHACSSHTCAREMSSRRTDTHTHTNQ